MNSIRIFLWTMIGAMTIQGFLHADEYGTSVSLLGGMSLTMAIWRERIGAYFASEPTHTRIPRSLVTAALHTTHQRGGMQSVPTLQRALKTEQAIWSDFHEANLQWVLSHTQLLGALQADPDARELWTVWDTMYRAAEQRYTEANKDVCHIVSRVLTPTSCAMYAARAAMATTRLASVDSARASWNHILEGHPTQLTDIERWWFVIRQPAPLNITGLQDRLARMYDIMTPTDTRLQDTHTYIRALVVNSTESPWMQRLTTSLLLGQAWAACLEHVRLRENRVRDLLIRAGIQELFHAYDTALNASLRVAQTKEETVRVQSWFDELAKYSWWLGEDIPNIVRRCLRQEGGECARIGPTEIQALSAQMNERIRILDDWSRRTFIGLWNAMPAVCLLFLVELIILCVYVRIPYIKTGGVIRDEYDCRSSAIADKGGRTSRQRIGTAVVEEEISERLDTRD